MLPRRSTQPTNTPPSLARRLAWPGTVSVVLAAIAACGGSSTGNADFSGSSAGAGGALGIAGSFTTTAGRSSGASGSASGGANGGNLASGGERAVGGRASADADEGGKDAGGESGMPGGPGMPGMPHDPPMPPGGIGGAAGENSEDCPLEPPTDKAACAEEMLRCEYPDLNCNCEGPKEEERKWKCRQPPKPMEMCPPLAPEDATDCKTAEPPAPPCHYEEAAVDCACTDDKWSCAEA